MSPTSHLLKRITLQSTRLASSTTKRRRVIDETTLAGAQHKVSSQMSTPSFGHMIAELSATRPGMEKLRQPGATMSEEQRTVARNVVKLVMGVPVLVGTGIVGWNFWTGRREE